MNLSTELMALGMALLSGIFMAVQGGMNGALSKAIGTWETTFLVHLLGTIVLAFFVFVFHLGQMEWDVLRSVPWYLYLGGIVSVFIVYLVAFSIPRVGAANATTAIIVGQVLMAVIIDHFGLFGLTQDHFEWRQGIGVILLAVGAKLLIG